MCNAGSKTHLHGSSTSATQGQIPSDGGETIERVSGYREDL